MPNQGTESQFEETTIDRLCALGYRYQYGGEIERDLRDVVMMDLLRTFLHSRYAHLPVEAVEEVVARFTRPEGVTTEQRNLHFHQLLTRGHEQKYRKADGTETFEHVHVVDWTNAAANDFCVMNQLPIHGQNNRRPDLLIYVNGLPLVLFELKNPYEEEPNTLGAFNQVQHYRAGIAQLFDFNALVVVSDGGLVGHAEDDTPHAAGSTLHGMWTAPWEWYAPWKSIDGRAVVESATGAMKTLIEGLFPKERLLDYLRHFIAFEVVNEKIEKKGAKYHQFFGIRFAVEEALRATRPDGDRKIGVVWHTQGSGKSLSMAYFVAILRHHPRMENPTFVIQVDRTDLDDQLHDQFVAVKALVGEVQHAESVTELRSLLRGEGGEVIFSTIEKFRLDEDEAVHPMLSERRNLIVIADEAHRTQYGLKEGFAYQLRRALPNASFIGFTGTPVSFAASDTEAVFGQVIHTYDMLQSKRDGSTVPIYYDPQLIRLELTNEKVDAELQEILEDTGADASQAERARWAAVAEAAGTKERIAELAGKLLDHFQKRNAMINGKAMVVCMSRRNCVRTLRRADGSARLPGGEDRDDRQSERRPARVERGGSHHDEAAARRDQGAYEGHRRSAEDRDRAGHVADGNGHPVPAHALHRQADEGAHADAGHRAGEPHLQQQAGRRDRGLHRHRRRTQGRDEALHARRRRGQSCAEHQRGSKGRVPRCAHRGARVPARGTGLRHLAHVAEHRVRGCLPQVLRPSPRDGRVARRFPHRGSEAQLRILAGESSARLHRLRGRGRVLPDPPQATAKDHHGWRHQRRREREGCARPARPEHREQRRRGHLPGGGHRNAGHLDSRRGVPRGIQVTRRGESAAEVARQDSRGRNSKPRERSNLAKYKSFKEMLEQSLQKYHNRAIQAADVVRVLIQIKQDMAKESERTKTLNLSAEELAFYDAVSVNVATLYDEKFLCDLVRDVVQAVKKNLKVDWTKPHREDVKAGVRAAVKTVLRKRGVKPEHLETLTKQVIIQAEAMFKEWPLAA